MSSTAVAPRARKTFSRLKHVLDLPNLIDIQKASFQWFLDEGLRETINDVSPIEDYTGNLAIVFGDFRFDDPTHSIHECREKDITYSRPLNVEVAFQNRETGETVHLDLDAVFVQIGLLPNTDFIKGGAIALSPFGEIEVDSHGATTMPGVFAAGDCTTVPYKQIIIAAGEGSKAALSAFDYLIRQ